MHTIVVVDEEGIAMDGIDVGIGFKKNTGSGTKGIPVEALRCNGEIYW